jgi:prepilin signal peptidase PulO-like enzyme (type II secretory pathway)
LKLDYAEKYGTFMSLFTLGSIAAFTGVSALPWIMVIAVALAAARVDLRVGRIPNKLTGPVLLAGLLWGLAATAGLLPAVSGAVSRGIGDSLLGALLAGFRSSSCGSAEVPAQATRS